MGIISIRANKVTDNQNGTFTVELPGNELTQEQNKLLESLFPDVLDGAYALLNKQNLLNCIATQSEVCAPKVNSHLDYVLPETAYPENRSKLKTKKFGEIPAN